MQELLVPTHWQWRPGPPDSPKAGWVRSVPSEVDTATDAPSTGRPTGTGHVARVTAGPRFQPSVPKLFCLDLTAWADTVIS